ncbi:hypothetical protein K0M31_016232 [Melipona bicolor]|uniref:Uncharacterized protein n=1 Tax=Melipona bicolor TaxID=60889 RepID=A0AA40G6P4_9HYME|nr:hypothetical protein K0M31_016232 [Melipona bicolor]
MESVVSPIVEIVANEDVESLPNKKLKVTNSSETVEPRTQNTAEDKLHITQANRDIEKEDNTIKKQITVTIQNKNIEVEQVCDKSVNETTSILVVTDTEIPQSTSPLNIIKQTDTNICVETTDTTEDNPNLDINSKISDLNEEHLQGKEKEEEEILQLFQDIPKNDN